MTSARAAFTPTMFSRRRQVDVATERSPMQRHLFSRLTKQADEDAEPP